MSDKFNTHLNSNEDQTDIFSLNEFLDIFKRRKKLIIFSSSIFFLITILFTIQKRIFNPVFVGQFTLLITDPLDAINKSKNSLGDSLIFEEIAQNTTRNDLPTLIRLLKSKAVLKPLTEKYNFSYQQLQKNIDINVPGKDLRTQALGILNVSFYGSKPYRMQKVLESIQDLYLQTAVSQKKQRVLDGLEFLNEQTPNLEKKTDLIQKQLADFRKKYNLIEPVEEGMRLKKLIGVIKNEINYLETYNKRLLDIKEAIRENKIDTSGFLEAVKPNQLPSSDVLNISNSDRVVITELLNVKKSLAEARSKYKSSSPMVKGLEERLKRLKPILEKNQLEAVNTAIFLNNKKIDNSKDQLSKLQKRFKKQPDLIKEYEALMQNLEIARRNLLGIVSAKERFQLEIAQTSVPWEVIASPEINPVPVKPSLTINFIYGILVSTFLGGVIGVIMDRLDYIYHNPEEIPKSLNLPMLGYLPHFEKFDLKISNFSNWFKSLLNFESQEGDQIDKFVFQESFRNVATSIRFLTAENTTKIYGFSSSIPGEGKTLISIILSKTLSELGSKVLLIDADLRKPQVHKRLELNNIQGLSNILTKQITLDDSIQKIDNLPNLSIITSGTIPPDPLNLLSSDNFKNLINTIKIQENYDIVIIDTSPILGLSDSSVISQYTDGCILVVSLDKVPRNLPKQSKEILINRKTKVLGVIVNSVENISSNVKENFGNYAYLKSKYGYGANYAYVYSRYASDKKEDEIIEQKEIQLSLKDRIKNISLKSILKKILNWFNE